MFSVRLLCLQFPVYLLVTYNSVCVVFKEVLLYGVLNRFVTGLSLACYL